MSVEIIRSSPLFNGSWYLSTHPDVAKAGADPAEHYLEFGWKEGREPSPEFSGAAYLRTHADVRKSGMNPLIHYLEFGQYEGRLLSSQHELWKARWDTLDDLDRTAIQDHIAQLKHRPLISVVVPVYQTVPQNLREMIASVFSQAYPEWELCIADDHSSDPELTEILREAATDPRVRVTVRETNGNICLATNAALDLATGEFLCFLDHDDLLHENALYEIAVELNTRPDADIIYTDCDSFDDEGHHYNPFFKPDWNYDLMLGQNIVNHLGSYRRSLVEKVGGMRAGYEGSQDYDLTLRVADETESTRIRHIPAILYHWRRSSSHTSFSDADHGRCVSAAQRAIADHLQRRGIDAQVEPCARVPNFTSVVYPVPNPAPLVSVCITAIDSGPSVVKSAWDILFSSSYQPVEVLVSAREADHSLLRLAQTGLIRILEMAADADIIAVRNAMICEARGQAIVLLDSGLQIEKPEWLTELVSHALREDVGAAGPLVTGSNGELQDAGIVVGAEHSRLSAKAGNPGYFANMALTREVSALGSACLVLKKSACNLIGGFASYPTLRESDLDFCLRLRSQGFRSILVPHVELLRAGSSQSAAILNRSTAEDPFYNPNLSVDSVYDRAVTPRRTKPWQATKQRHMIRRGQHERAAQLLAGVERSAKLLEIGPSYSPIAPRSEGWNTKIVDHTSREHLVDKYKAIPDVWVERIEEVDYIWLDGSIADSLPADERNTFDYLVASHVVEHLPDFIGFLQSAALVLKETGVMILAVPDKRFCFDYFRTVSMTGDLLEAHLAKRTRHTRRTAFEHLFHTVLKEGAGAWGQEQVAGIGLANSFDDCVRWMGEFDANTSGGYIDYHAWRFTPSSFQLLILELGRLGYTDWAVQRITPAAGCEFHVTLRREGAHKAKSIPIADFDRMRLHLLNSRLAELGEQVAYAGFTAGSGIRGEQT